MQVIPAVDILGGRCVQLTQGDYARDKEYNSDPVAAALEWQRLGAQRLHTVDLDGAREGRPVNRDTIVRIARALSIPVQAGGGIRDETDARSYVDSGLSRVILGTAAVEDQALVGRLVGALGEALVAGIDARDGIVMTRGWLQSGEVKALDLARALRDAGVARFVYTDISRDGMLQGPNIAALSEFIAVAGGAVIASGGITNVENIIAAAEAGAEAAIVGTALYEGRFTLAEAGAALAARGASAHAGGSHI